MTKLQPKDQRYRDLIETEFDRNLLVEAGAGSGKTRSLARRMAAGIAAGTYDVRHMAAVTFTRKAAAELRGRFQLALEEMQDEAKRGAGVAQGFSPAERNACVGRIEHALSNLERFYAGTIHAFCAHLLRERPVESGIAPGFTELDEAEDAHRREESWREYITYARASGKPELLDLLAAGVKASHLDDAFKTVCLYDEVTFPAPTIPCPDTADPWKAVRKFGAALEKVMPPKPNPESKCGMLSKAEEFTRRLRFADSSRPSDLVRLLELWDSKGKITYKWWDNGGGDGHAAQDLIEQFRSAIVQPFLTQWREYLYHLSVTVLMDARAHAREDRRRRNTLNYGDLLQMAAKVLRENSLVRRALQQKYQWLFVDEFQDTDPVQAEIIVLLAAQETDETGVVRAFRPADTVVRAFRPADTVVRAFRPADTAGRPFTAAEPHWTSAQLRPGALFVVGDPKQSIYRFRRADIDIYARVKQIIKDSGGEVVPLTANFRSVPAVCDWANEVFKERFPAKETTHAPKFEPLNAFRAAVARGFSPASPEAGVHTLPVSATVDQKEVCATEAAAIARYIRSEVDAGRRKFGDFLILTRKKKPLAAYASALEALQIPAEVSGAGAFGNSEEVRHLSLLLRALADPQDTVTLVGVLRGPFFGLSDQELFDFVQSGNRLWLFAGGEPSGRTNGENHPAEPSGRTSENRPAEPPVSTDRQNHPSEAGSVSTALDSLRLMYRWTRLLPPAAAVDKILEFTGYLALAACTPGGAEAGDLLHAIDRIRQVAEDGGTLMDAVESLEEDAEGSSEIDSLPLEPGRGDVVRLMNLHKAKGLEAPVVFLADPCGGYPQNVDVRIVRSGHRADGYFQLCEKGENSWHKRVVARPPGWDVHEQAERPYLEAEVNRLFYVAATRAKQLLVVGRWEKSGGRGPRAWDFDKWLAKVPALKVPEKVKLPPPARVDLSPAASQAADTALAARFDSALKPSYSITSVTAEARHIAKMVRKAEAAADDPSRTVTQDTPAHRADAGMAWGTLIHGLLEHAMRQNDLDADHLRRLAMWLTVEQPHLRSVIDRAIAVVQEVSRAPFWLEAQGSAEQHVETPFATANNRAVLMGVIDLVFHTPGMWQIVDYKTDRHLSPAAMANYKPQLDQYGAAWETITGDNAAVKLWEVSQ